MNDFQIQPQMSPINSFGPPVQPYLPKPDHRKRNFIILFCVLAAIVIIVLAGWFSYTHSASYRIRKGFMRLIKEAGELKNPMNEKLGTEELYRMFFTEGLQADTELNVTFDTFLGEFTLGMDTDFAKDMKKRELSSSTAFSIMNYEFGHLDVYADDENFCFSVPELFLENLYLENENVLGQYNRSIWADEVFGEREGDDFNIDLFSAPWYYRDGEGAGKAFLRRYAAEIESCRRSMTMDKAGDGVYRIRFDGGDLNYLIWLVLSDYLNDNMNILGSYRENVLGALSYFDAASGPEEISFLLEIDDADRIESIRLEHPLSLGNGAVRIDGDVYFLGGKNSLERMQGRITYDNKNDEVYRDHEVVWQVVRSLEQGAYKIETETKYSVLIDDRKLNTKVEADFSYDGPKNSFKARSAFDILDSDYVWEAEGEISHIKRGESFQLKLDELRRTVDGEQTVLVRGEIDLGPLSRKVKQIVEPKTALFSMGEDEWIKIIERIDREYSYLWEMAADYLW